MKYLVIGILFSANAFSATFFPVGKNGAKAFYIEKGKCETIEEAVCYDVSGKDLRFYLLQSTEVDDLSKPIFKTQYNVDSCDNPEECGVLAVNKAATCTDAQGDYAGWAENTILPGYKVFCTGIEGYEKKTVVDLALDAELQSQVLAADAVKTANETAMQTVKRRMACGKNVQATMVLRNASKNLTTEQVKSFAATYAEIKSLLDTASLVTAKAEVEAIAPDGTLVTNDDKTAIIQAIDACLQ